MKERIDVRALHGPLMDAGIVPKNCRLMSMQVGVSGGLSVTYEVYLTAQQLVTLGDIFRTVGTLADQPGNSHGTDN
jgi:hypothetical protein